MTDTPGTLEERLPCDVLVQPATLIERGCKIETLLECIELRRERSEKGPPLNDILSKRQADEISSLRARVEVITGALEKLIVTVEFEVPPIRDGVDVDHRLDVLAMSAREARQALKDTPDAK